MDQTLHDALKRWHDQIDKLDPLEARYLELEGSEKSFLAQLTIAQEGRSMAERETKALASKEWSDFKRGLAKAKTEYNRARRELDLKINAYYGYLNTYKNEMQGVRSAS